MILKTKNLNIDSKLYRKLVKRLALWYGKNKRELPFRGTRDPYLVWISEVMLQQTRVSAMLPIYEKFILRFPNIKSLALADVDDVLYHFRGLGYYKRARLLHKGAGYVYHSCMGNFPSSYREALHVPGIGDYSASSILSICFDLPHPVLDGNVRRVIQRLFMQTGKAQPPLDDVCIRERIVQLMELRGKTSAGDHNQAMMELGATVCMYKKTLCKSCPMQMGCSAFLHLGEHAASVPVLKKTKKKMMFASIYFFTVSSSMRRNDEEVKIWIRKKTDSKLLKNQWTLPVRWSELKVSKDTSSDVRISHSIMNWKIEASVVHHRVRSSWSADKIKREFNLADEQFQDDEWMLLPKHIAEKKFISSLMMKALKRYDELNIL